MQMLFPGEPYRLLQGIVKSLEPKNVIEIGTGCGRATRVILDNTCTELHTFDIVPLADVEDCLITTDDRRCIQHTVDLSDDYAFALHSNLLATSDFIYMDGPKDDGFEVEFLRKLSTTRMLHECYLMMDDIRFSNMWDLWRRIESPKIDLTSFGHWSGTGLVNISRGLIMGEEL